jgi:hypothetical protein
MMVFSFAPPAAASAAVAAGCLVCCVAEVDVSPSAMMLVAQSMLNGVWKGLTCKTAIALQTLLLLLPPGCDCCQAEGCCWPGPPGQLQFLLVLTLLLLRLLLPG